MTIIAGTMQSIGTGGWFITTTAPGAPTLTLASSGDATATLTVDGDAGVTNQLYYRIAGQVAWTTGESRSGDGDIVQTGLTNGRLYEFFATSISGGLASAPSGIVTAWTSASTVSIIERIAQAVLAVLNQVVDAGDAASAERIIRAGLPESPGHQKLFLFQDDAEELEATQIMLAWRLPFVVLAYVRPADSSSSAIDTPINELRSQVERQLRVDYTLGGLARDLRIRPPFGFAYDSDYEGVMINFDIDFETLESNPYSQS